MLRRSFSRLFFVAFVAALLALSTHDSLRAATGTIPLIPLGPAPGPIGIDQISCGGGSAGPLVVSVNWPTGVANNLATFNGSSFVPFSSLANRPTELKVATVHTAIAGFALGDLFTANGSTTSGGAADLARIVKITNNGATVNDTWVTFSATENSGGLVVGSMFQDGTGLFGGDLIVVLTNDEPGHVDTTGSGQVWRVKSDGTKTQVPTGGNLPQHLEGVTAVAFGPASGAPRILVGGLDRIFVLDGVGGVKTIGYNLSPAADYPTPEAVAPEDLDLIPHSGTFYGVDFGGNRVLTAPVSSPGFADFAGQVLITQEVPGTFEPLGLYALDVSGPTVNLTVLGPTVTSSRATQWEHVTFGDVIHDCTPPSLSITKGPVAMTINAGGTASFVITVTNNGPVAATNVVITDTLPTTPGALSWTTSDAGCTISGGNSLSCNVGTLAYPGSKTVTVSAVTSVSATCGPITNPLATVTATNAGTKTSGPATVNINCAPAVTIVKLTNGADANNPNAAGVPNIAPGGTVTWTYQVKDTGNSAVPKANVSVTDSQSGVTPAPVLSGGFVVGDANNNNILDPGETWIYQATGTALNLTLTPPAGITTVVNSCTAGGTQPARTAYTNVGTATIPGATATDPSSYCNPPSAPPAACVLGYPYTSSVARTSTVFNESGVLEAFGRTKTATQDTVEAYDDDEHAMLLGVRTATMPVSPLPSDPGHVANPLVGDPTLADGFGRPFFPSVYITDVTGLSDNATNTDPAFRAGDWQYGGTPIAPNDVFGVWKGASISGTTITTDADPAQNSGNYGTGSDPAPAGFTSQGWNAEPRWNVSSLTDNHGKSLIAGRTYRIQFIVHDGDQNKTGGDVGEACLLVDPGFVPPPPPTVSVTGETFAAKELQVTIANTGSADVQITGFKLTWPNTDGSLNQLKLNANVIYGPPAIPAPSANLTTAQLVASPTPRTITHGTSGVLHVVFQNNADANKAHYSGGLVTFSNGSTVVIP